MVPVCQVYLTLQLALELAILPRTCTVYRVDVVSSHALVAH